VRSFVRACAACVALGLLSVIGACASTDEPAHPKDDPDAGTLTAADGSAPEDAGGDGEVRAPRECSDDGFCHTLLPKNQTLRSVWADGQGVAWAVSEQGAVLRWDGKTWDMHVSGLGKLTVVWGSGPTDVWVGGENRMFHGTGASAAALTFAPTPAPTGEVSSIWGTLTVPADDESGIRSRVLHTTGGGVGWAVDPMSTDNPDIRFLRVWGSAASGVWLAGTILDPDVLLEMGKVFRRTPSASTFEEVTLPGRPDGSSEFDVLGELVSTAMISDTDMIVQARTSGGEAIFVRGTSTDVGQTFTWTSELDGTFEDPATNVISAVAQDNAWAAGEYGRIRHWDGTEWIHSAITVTDYPVIAPFYGTWANGPNDVWFVGDNVALRLDPAKKKHRGTR
jgi:hypothetical protein